jgi:hypothetical protein
VQMQMRLWQGVNWPSTGRALAASYPQNGVHPFRAS